MWRQGRRVPHHLYRQKSTSAAPSTLPWPDGDEPIAMFIHPDDAKRAVDAVARVAELEAEVERLAKAAEARGGNVSPRELRAALTEGTDR